jgi:hypothetical protein
MGDVGRPKRGSYLTRAWSAARDLEWNWSLLGYLGVSGKVTTVVTGIGTSAIAFLGGSSVAPVIVFGLLAAAAATVVVAGARAPRPAPSELEWGDENGYMQIPPQLGAESPTVGIPEGSGPAEPGPHSEAIQQKDETIGELVQERIARLDEVKNLKSELSQLEEKHKKTAATLEHFQTTAIQQQRTVDQGLARIAALEPYAPDPPPESDLTDAERAVAFSELGKLKKKVDFLHGPTLSLLTKASDVMVVKHDGVAVDLIGFLKERLKPPAEKLLDQISAALKNQESAEAAQDFLAEYVRVFNSMRRWIARSAAYGDVSPEALEGYSEWRKMDEAFWLTLDHEATETGPLRRLYTFLGGWCIHGERPYPMPQPLPDRLHGTDNRFTDDERG